jgi:FkbM family methyltransferase
MSTNYFLLTRAANAPINNRADHQITHLAGENLLPCVNLDYYAKNGLFESGLIEWSKQFCKKDKIFLDIGAHTGTYSISLAHLCSQVFAFEPQRATYYALCGGVAMSGLSDKIVCVQAGLGSLGQEGRRVLNVVSRDGGGSSLHRLDEPLLGTEQINVNTLDSYGLSDVGFVKMDVEGNELEVLRGGRDTLIQSGFPPILMEINTQEQFELIGNYLREIIGYTRFIRVSGTQNMALAVHE